MGHTTPRAPLITQRDKLNMYVVFSLRLHFDPEEESGAYACQSFQSLLVSSSFPSAPPLFSWSWKSWSPFTSPPRVLAVNSPLRVPRAPHPRAQMYNFRFETIDFTRPPVRQRLCTIPPRPPHPPQVRPSSPKDFPKAIIGGRPRLRDQLLLLS